MVGNAHSAIEITACNLAITTLPDLHMVGAEIMNLLPSGSVRCLRTGRDKGPYADTRDTRVAVLHLHSGSCVGRSDY